LKHKLWLLALLAIAGLATHADSPPNLQAALDAQIDLVAAQPKSASAQNDLGNLYVLAGRLDDAEQAFARSIDLDRTQVTARFNLALLLERQGKKLGAMHQLDAVLDRQPDHAWAQYQRGAIYESWGFRSRAIKAYAKAFALDRRLSFPEVNPHVIENHLLAEALLETNKEPGMSLLAPPRYEDPSRIAALLLDLPSARTAVATADGGKTPAPLDAASQIDIAAGRDGGPNSRTLDAGSVPAGGVSRASTATGGLVARGTPTGGVREIEGTTVRSWVAGEDDAGTNPPPVPGTYPTPGMQVVPGGIRPSVYSTGRLDLRLVPMPSARDRAGR
jgi:Flp pilus assembly protein TadD